MDASRFDHLSRGLATPAPRRRLLAGAAALALGNLAPRPDAVGARREHGGLRAESFRKRKQWYCLHGESVKRYRRKQEKLLAAGATLGKCAACAPLTCAQITGVCGAVPDGCGGQITCPTCSGGLTCCAAVCVNITNDPQNCGGCGIACAPNFPCINQTCPSG